MTAQTEKGQHTPGPWLTDKDHHVYAKAHYKPAPFTDAEGTRHEDFMLGLVALPYSCGGGTYEGNARLIAAAPALLEALQRLLGYLDTLHVYPGGDVNMEGVFKVGGPTIAAARAAIRLAEGEDQ